MIMHQCTSCDGCGGCDRSLTLTQPELALLKTLAQFPFLPVARTAANPSPVYLEETEYPQEEYTLILQCLEKKGLISLDFDNPLKNADYSRYAACPIHGSMALTARGQQVIELLEIQGAEE